MSKLHLLFAFLLVGCASTPPQPVEPKAPDHPVIIARGTDGIVNWDCSLEELNDKLAWVQCDFHNGKPVTESACIKVTFYNQDNMKPVVESREFCSGVLMPNNNSTNYAAFIKEKRNTLRQCGELLDLCVMLAGPVK